MKVKKYEVVLTNPEAVHTRSFLNRQDVVRIFEAIELLWDNIDFEEWALEISPYWEEVPDNA